MSADGVTASQVLKARALAAGLQQAEVRRLVVVGDSLGVDVRHAEDFPILEIKTRANHDTLAVYEQAGDLDWTYVIPAVTISAGKRTGLYRIGLASLATRSAPEVSVLSR
jgi:putative NADH-flavin reductase